MRLKVQFKNGQLHGRQAVFTIENKLKCLIDFEQGKFGDGMRLIVIKKMKDIIIMVF